MRLYTSITELSTFINFPDKTSLLELYDSYFLTPLKRRNSDDTFYFYAALNRH